MLHVMLKKMDPLPINEDLCTEVSQFLLEANCFKVGSTNKLDNFNKEKALCVFIIVSLSKLDR